MAQQVDAQYIIEKRERLHRLEEYLNGNSQYQIIELHREHERWLCQETNYHAQELINYEIFCDAQRILAESETIERMNANFEKKKKDKQALLEEKIARIYAKADQKIEAARRYCTMRCWTCADDGLAHPFEYRCKKYYRTYSGTMWHAGNEGQLSEWAGIWNGIYIGKGEEPQEKPAVALL